ncbi:MAG TPA: oxidative damage protection protein [Candidatus Acidoferrales bacterium]|nr:oxidative damage protection protein [Candidatus Acidoferrales bacterium]
MADENDPTVRRQLLRRRAGQSVRMMKCVKLGREMPGLDRIPWKDELGKRVYDNVSKEAWRMWVEHSKMLKNEFRLNRSIRIRRRSCLRRGGRVAR